jgi:ABC-type glycerol-3-phosphate transport system permease component
VENPTLKNFKDLFRIMGDSWVPFSRYIFNTFFITIVGTVGHVYIASLCAYAMSKHKFPGQNLLFGIVVLSLMFSTAVTQIPNFIIMSKLRWIDTYKALIIPAFASPLGLYLMKQFMEQMVPDTVLEAARIDGGSEIHIFSKIVMPIVKPAWLTLIMFSFQGLWGISNNSFIRSEQLKPLNNALSQILAGGIARAGTGAAAAVVMMIVPILIFVITQSNIIETMSTSGMKD